MHPLHDPELDVELNPEPDEFDPWLPIFTTALIVETPFFWYFVGSGMVLINAALHVAILAVFAWGNLRGYRGKWTVRAIRHELLHQPRDPGMVALERWVWAALRERKSRSAATARALRGRA